MIVEKSIIRVHRPMSKNKNWNKGVHPKNLNNGVHPNFGQKPLKCIWVTSRMLKTHYFWAKC